MSVSFANVSSHKESINSYKTNSSIISNVKFETSSSNLSSTNNKLPKNGYGKWSLSNGEYFEGFFSDGKRCKIGFQKWNDGDQYIGEYFEDKRHGWGRYTWFNNDVYEGSFYHDSRHGYGTYRSAQGDFFEGTFIQNCREGFGILTYDNGDKYIGLYKDNYRCGPGILYYNDGRRDVGLWYRNSIFKLIVEQPGMFHIDQFSALINNYIYNKYEVVDDGQFVSVGHDGVDNLDDNEIFRYRLLEPKEIAIFQIQEISIDETASESKVNSEDKKSIISSKDETEQMDRLKDQLDGILKDPLTDSTIHIPNDDNIEPPPSEVSNKDVFSIESIENQPITDSHKTESRKEPIELDDTLINFLQHLSLPSNTTPTMKKIIIHISEQMNKVPIEYKKEEKEIEIERNNEENRMEHLKINDVYKKVIYTIFGNKDKKSKKKKEQMDIIEEVDDDKLGDNEIKSHCLLSLCHNGDLDEIRKLFMSNIPPNINVTDRNGSFALLEATLTWEQDLINFLLDNGADINQVSDEGVNALGGCMLFYYPTKNFLPNIAETCIELSQTPLNYNGVRREFTLPPKLQHRINSKEPPSSDELAILFEEMRSESEMKLQNEKWNTYQSFLIDEALQNKDKEEENETASVHESQDSNEAGTSQEFVSNHNQVDFKSPDHIKKSLIEKAASVLSANTKLIKNQSRPNSCNQTISKQEGIARYLALKIARIQNMRLTIELLLRRGANPNICHVPFSPLFFAVKSGDYEMAKLLISKGADVNCRLTPQNGYLTPLHISVSLPGRTGIMITELLLESGADTNARAKEDSSFLDEILIDEWRKDEYNEELQSLIGGKTPIHIVCSRYDSFTTSHKICKILLDNGANPNLICNGHTALTLAIASGNDMIVNELLSNPKTNVNQRLSHGNCNAMCIATSTAFEHTRTIDNRLILLRKLIDYKVDMLEPALIGGKRLQGTAIDFAYHIFNMDQRIARLPYHALTTVERDIFNNRKKMLSYVGMYTREAAVQKEKDRLESLKLDGIQSRGPSPDFVYTGAGADPSEVRPSSHSSDKFPLTSVDTLIQGSELLARKPLYKYCYECGRSVNVKLTACTRCKEVFFCSKHCKTKAWNTRHKFECLRVGGRASTAGGKSQSGLNRKTDSPTPATIADDKQQNDADGTTKQNLDNLANKANLLNKSKSNLSQKTDQFSYGLYPTGGPYPKKLPPLDGKSHPAYSYMFINNHYIKVDVNGKILALEDGVAMVDNYSFN